MARRTTKTAPADQSDAPVKVARLVSKERDGQHYPSYEVSGEAPRKGSTVRITLENGVTYSGKAAGAYERDGKTFVETDGLTPEE